LNQNREKDLRKVTKEHVGRTRFSFMLTNQKYVCFSVMCLFSSGPEKSVYTSVF